LYRRERTGKGSYVTTSLIAGGVWSCGVSVQAALCDAEFYPLHDRKKPANAAMNLYKTADDSWFLLVVTPDKLAAVAKGIGRADLLTDARFSDPEKLAANMGELTAILDDVFEKAHITFGVVQTPSEVIHDPQLRENDVIVPLEGAGGNLKLTISSPIQVHDVAKVAAKRAPHLGEHNDEILGQLGFDQKAIDGLRASGAIPTPKPHAKVG